MTGWLKRRRVRKTAALYWQHLRRGEAETAQRLFETELSIFGSELSAEIRLAELLNRFRTDSCPEAYREIRRLADGSESGDSRDRVHLVASRMDFQRIVTRALRSGDTKSLFAWEGHPEARRFSPCESLGELVLLATGKVPGVTDIPAKLLAHLPKPSELPDDRLRSVWATLFCWAAIEAGQLGRLVEDETWRKHLSEPFRTRVLLRLNHRFGPEEMAQGRLQRTFRLYEEVEPGLTDRQREALVQAWAIAGIRGSHLDSVLEWIDRHKRQGDTEKETDKDRSLSILRVIAELKLDHFHRARESIDAMLSSGDGSGVSGYLLFLTALSQLASAAALFEANRELGRPAGWASIAAPLGILIERLEQSDTHRWCADFFRGIMAYGDPRIKLSPELIQRFESSIDFLRGSRGRAALEEMVRTLRSRYLVTEETVTHIQNGDIAELRRVKSSVHDQAPDAIPPILDAATRLALWNAGDKINPLPSISRVRNSASNEEIGRLDQAARQIPIREAVQQLASSLSASPKDLATVPDLDALPGTNDRQRQLGAFGRSLVLARMGKADESVAVLPDNCPSELRPLFEWFRFHLAWQTGDMETCRSLAPKLADNPSVPSPERTVRAVWVRSLLAAMNDNQLDLAEEMLRRLGGGRIDGVETAKVVISLSIRLLQAGRALESKRLTQAVHRLLSSEPDGRYPDLAWICAIVETLSDAALGDFTASISAAERVLAQKQPENSILGDAERRERLIGWIDYLRFAAELANVATHESDLRSRWPSVRRRLFDEVLRLEKRPALQAYADLFVGLATYLGSGDRIADEDTVRRLSNAQRSLALRKSDAFLRQVVDRLTWHRKVLDDFWDRIRNRDFVNADKIYREEILQILGRRIPAEIEFGRILIQWSTGQAAPEKLLEQLDRIGAGAGDSISPELIERVRNQIDQDLKIRRLAEDLRSHRFRELDETIDRINWVGLERGSLPVPVAMLRLLARYKIRMTEEACQLGEQLGNGKFAPWIKNCAHLVVGFIEFHEEHFAKAADAFEAIDVSHLLGHDVDRYWAAAKFSQGVRFLNDDKPDRAFEAFSKSAEMIGDASLAPLFIHFGVKSLVTREGISARHVFSQLAHLVERDHDRPTAPLYGLLGELGRRLCHALTENDVSEIGGDWFLELLDQTASIDAEQLNGLEGTLKRNLRILAICQELRRQARLEAGSDQLLSPVELRNFFNEQLEKVEEADRRSERNDPVNSVLRGIVNLRFGANLDDEREGIRQLERALRFGVPSRSLANLLQARRERFRLIRENCKDALNFFDVYLACGQIPSEIREAVACDGNLKELYRLNRTYSPAEVLAPSPATPTDALEERMAELEKFLKQESLSEDEDLRAAGKMIKDEIEQMRAARQRVLATESKILGRLGYLVREASLEERELPLATP